MSLHGTDAYGTSLGGLPPLVARAVRAAREDGFPNSCRPEQGRLLHTLAGGAGALRSRSAGARSAEARSTGALGRIGESGTGYGVGLAWLAAGAPAGVELISVEREPARAAAAAALLADVPGARVLTADWTELYRHAPYDLLVLDGGGQAKGNGTADPERLLVPGGVLVVDDFTPSPDWPPTHDGRPDDARLHWLLHPALNAVEIPLAANLSAIVAVRKHQP
ncbi:class I SAM-dependent methyltransferase [Kitasatospora paracochleata]|uniref:O-methyltransferase YrrM n=1 Tax=Kitasatospora paracochleata TaxID=58354 RepID=A0ABT1J634_9ACTN|nr:class I SAM-dependent methyltransferase [Kitasatospora paracochleata]MCP2312900.1 putative O-methyltransferase YrrM [Kitasatospora paracochleata]